MWVEFNKWKAGVIPGLYHGRDEGSRKTSLKEMVGGGEDTIFLNLLFLAKWMVKEIVESLIFSLHRRSAICYKLPQN